MTSICYKTKMIQLIDYTNIRLVLAIAWLESVHTPSMKLSKERSHRLTTGRCDNGAYHPTLIQTATDKQSLFIHLLHIKLQNDCKIFMYIQMNKSFEMMGRLIRRCVHHLVQSV